MPKKTSFLEVYPIDAPPMPALNPHQDLNPRTTLDARVQYLPERPSQSDRFLKTDPPETLRMNHS